MPNSNIAGDERPRGIVPRLIALSQLAYSAHPDHMIAVSRTICALVLLLFDLTGAIDSGFRINSGDVLLLAFAGFAITTLIISFRNWYLDFTLSRTFILVDILAFAILTTSHTAMDAGSVAAMLCLLAHILFASVLRWRTGFVFLIAALLSTFWIAEVMMIELPRGAMDPAKGLRWSLFVMLESLIVIWASAHMLKLTLPRFAGNTPDPGLPLAVSAMSYAMEMARAGDAVLCWIDRDDRGCCAYDPRTLEDRRLPAKLSFGAADAFRMLELMLFDVSRRRAILSKDGKFVACAGSDIPGLALLEELGVGVGICIPVDGDEDRSWLVLTGISMLGWGHLHLAGVIRSEIRQGMAWQIASANALNSALLRLRRTVAYDLHDSVAHSLAGARFLLVALRSKIGENPEAVKEIDTIKDALDAEHLHVRSLIERLRETESQAGAQNLIEDLEAVRQALELRWQIEIELIDSDFRIQVPVWLSLEVQQIVREAVSNGVRHGKASKITIKCNRRLGSIEIEVLDNGSGFADPQTPDLPRSISERLGELGGSLNIVSNPGSTALQMNVPSSAVD